VGAHLVPRHRRPAPRPAPPEAAYPHRQGHRAPIAAMTMRATILAVGSPRHAPRQRGHCCRLGSTALAQRAHHRWPPATATGGWQRGWRHCIGEQWCALVRAKARGPLQAVTASRAMRWQATQHNSAGCGCSSTANGKPPCCAPYSHGASEEAAGVSMILSALR